MAALLEEAMESYQYQPPYNPYRYYPKGGKGGPWRQRSGCSSGYFSNYGDSAACAAAAAEYLEGFQRAQLKALLAQVNPALTPRMRRANTKEVGIQVNPRKDVAVQCSLGPRPLLLLRRRGAPSAVQQEQGQGQGSGFPIRFPRTLALYSPVASRRLTAFLQEEEKKEEKEPPKEGPPEDGPSREGESESEAPKEKEKEKEEEEEEEEEEKEEEETQVAQSKTRVRFQFLEQKYGYYHCKDCNIRWESAYVWCVQGTNKVYFRQFCRTCQKSYNPYRVEDITCQSCKQTRCTCPVKLRHVDPKRPHRQDLCGRCKGKRLSCDSTFSFKYII